MPKVDAEYSDSQFSQLSYDTSTKSQYAANYTFLLVNRPTNSEKFI